MTFTCRVKSVGYRWECTDGTTGKTWLAGPDYKYQGALANEVAVVTAPTPTPILQPYPMNQSKDRRCMRTSSTGGGMRLTIALEAQDQASAGTQQLPIQTSWQFLISL